MNSFLVFAFAVSVRFWLIYAFPQIFGGDTVLRMANRDRVQLAYQLPLLQAAVFGVSRFFDGPLAIRCMMAMIGGIASVACYRLASDLTHKPAALLVGLLFASNPFLIQLSIVPYQEVLMLGGLLFAFHFFFQGWWLASSCALALACLTRYEAWAACPVLIVTYVWKHEFRRPEMLKALVYFGWAPVMWIVWNAGISAPGTFVIEWPRSPFRLMRYVYLGWITGKNTPVPVLLLVAVGLWRACRTNVVRDWRVQVLGSFFALVVLAILFSAHGEAPDPERFVTAREASIWIAALVLSAAIALRDCGRAWRAIAGLGILLGVVQAHYAVRRDTSAPQIQVAHKLARYLEAELGSGENAIILTKPVPPELVQQYLDKVARRGSDAGLQHARKVLKSTETSPPDYQRTLVHSWLGKDRLVSLAGNVGGDPAEILVPRCSALAAVWSDFSPSNAVEANFHASNIPRGMPVHRIASGALSVTLYRLQLPAACRG